MSMTLPIATLSLALLVATDSVAEPKPGKGNQGNPNRESYQQEGPQLDTGRIRQILLADRHLLAPAEPLPPGLARNLARGKPLPPGIAKRMNGDLLDRLPRHEGYDWRQVGRDVVLVAVATGIIHEVFERILD